MIQSTMIVGPSHDENGRHIPTDQRLRAIKLTKEEIDRVGYVFAYGPVAQKPIDKALIEAGIFGIYDDDGAVEVTGKGWGKESNFYNPDGSVRLWLQADARMPETDKERYHNALSDKNNQKIYIHQMQNALIAFLQGDPRARELAANCMATWVEC